MFTYDQKPIIDGQYDSIGLESIKIQLLLKSMSILPDGRTTVPPEADSHKIHRATQRHL